MAKVSCLLLALAAALLATASATTGPYAPGSGCLPTGSALTADKGGPYNISLLVPQYNALKAAIYARQDYTDKDIIHFLTNVECLEGLFDTWGTFGRGFNGDLEKGGPKPIGVRKANLSRRVQSYLEEVALNEQGHALFTREAGSANPCPHIDITGGWNKWLAAAFELPAGVTIKEKFGEEFDPFRNDANFVLCVTILEEIGAAGNQGLALLMTNPVLAAGVAGLATSAYAQTAVERVLLYEMQHKIVHPFGENVKQVFARASRLRDQLSGNVLDDQGIVNTDPRFISVPTGHVNNIATDVRGLPPARTPQQNINILTLGNPEGKGVFFPKGLLGRIRKPTGYNLTGDILVNCQGRRVVREQRPSEAGEIKPPVTFTGPRTVPEERILTQDLTGPRTDGTKTFRGYVPVAKNGPANFDKNVKVPVGQQNGAEKRYMAEYSH